MSAGGGLSQPRPGLADDQAEAWRGHLLRATRTVADQRVCSALLPVFAATQGGPVAQLVRMLGLLGGLPEALAALRGAVRREARVERWWASHPHGGRIDVVASTLAHVRQQPRAWRMMRVHAHAETATNTLIASALSDAQERLQALRHVGLYATEAAAFDIAERHLARFMARSPLQTVPTVEPRRWPALRAASRVRTVEHRRIGPFLRWWDATRATQLTAARTGAGPLSLGACFELTTLIHLLAQAADAIGPPTPGAPAMVDGQRVWVRNLDAAGAADLRQMLPEGDVLITPAEVPIVDGRPRLLGGLVRR